MSQVRFNQIFFGMMASAFASAFILPASATDGVRVHFAGIFAPLSTPSRKIAHGIYDEFITPAGGDLRPQADIATENQWLRDEVSRLHADVDRLQKLEAEGSQLGDLRSLCQRVTVTGSDSAGRDSLLLANTPFSNLRDGAPAIYSGGVAGRVSVGLGGARLRLITDYGFSVTGRFIRFSTLNGRLIESKINVPTPLVQGAGHSQLVVRGMKASDFAGAGLTIGDWIVVDDADWPRPMQGLRLGRIVSAENSRQAPGFVEIRLRPESDLTHLMDVWVLTRTSTAR